jgi:hypothetical protein
MATELPAPRTWLHEPTPVAGEGWDAASAGLGAAIRRERAALCWIGLWPLFCAALVRPLTNVPIIDDWTYAASVEQLLQTGRLRILEISAIYPVTQVLWGALFSLPFGFSFGALRISTVALAMLGGWAFYLTLRELGFVRRFAMIGTFLLTTNPTLVLLAHSFMADVPALSLASCATLLLVRGWQRSRLVELWAAVPFSMAAVMARQVAIAVPLAALIACLLGWRRWGAVGRAAVVPLVAGLASSLASWVLAGELLGPALQEAERLQRLRYIFSLGLGDYAKALFEIALAVAFMLVAAPLATLSPRRPRRLALVLLATAVLGVAAWTIGHGAVFDPLAQGTLSLNELGKARELMPGSLPRAPLAPIAGWAVQALMLCGAAVVLVALAVALRRRRLAPPRHFGHALLAVSALLQLSFILALWLYNDRYYLLLLPPAIVLLLHVLEPERVSTPVLVGLLSLQAAIGIVGTRDALAYNEVCQRAHAALMSAGVPPREIDAGWSFNGWMLYAHPQRLAPGEDRNRDVAQVTAKTRLRYSLAVSPLPGYRVLRAIRWRQWAWPTPSQLLVLQRIN